MNYNNVNDNNKTSSEALKDYTNTIAAIYLLEEVMDQGAVISINSAQKIITQENEKENPTIGSVVKKILAKANTTKAGYEWKKNEQDNQDHLEVAIAVGGAVYTVDFIRNSESNEDKYTVHIQAKLEKEGEIAGRGKLFLNQNHEVEVKMEIRNGIFYAKTKKELEIHAKSFLPHAPQNEVLAKFAESIGKGNDKRLAVMGTGSGKSIIMAGIAQAVGRTVMIVPDRSLVAQQVKETKNFIEAGEKKSPSIFTFDTLKNDLDIDNIDELKTDEKNKIKDYFSKVIGGISVGTPQVTYDQIVLQAEHPFFKLLASEIKNSMVLIDESHQQTFTQEDTERLKTIIENNTTLALTATPTSKLYELFPGELLDNFSLGSAIELGSIRPIKPEVAYVQEDDLVEQAVIHYFNDYYLTKGSNGYVAPGALYDQLKRKSPETPIEELKENAINQAVELNRIRCQRNMSFSDDPKTRTMLASIYKLIAEGDKETLEKYQSKVQKLRSEAEIEARIKLDIELTPLSESSEKEEERRARIANGIHSLEINLMKDIQDEQKKDIERTINSYAINLILGDKQAIIAEKDRTHKLESYLNEYDEDISSFKNNRPINNKSREEKFKACQNITRDRLRGELLSNRSAVLNLPKDQQKILMDAICDRALELAKYIAQGGKASAILNSVKPFDLSQLENTQRSYVGTLDTNTKNNNQKLIDEYLAQIEVGTMTHIVSDKVIATGVSIKDVLNVQIINNYSEKIEEDPNSINGPLSCPQAVGRCVRNADSMARGQQFIDNRYEGKKLITTVHDIIDPKQSAAKIKGVTLTRDNMRAKQMAPHHSVTNKYKYGQINRDHFFAADGSKLKEDLRQLKGDELKSKILESFQKRIEGATDTEKLKELKPLIRNSEEYAVLAQGQGWFTRIFHIKKSSIKALESMFAEQKEYLRKGY